MKKFVLALVLCIAVLTGCTQYIWVPVYDYDNNDNKPSEEPFVPDATDSAELKALLTAFANGQTTSAEIKLADGNYVLDDTIEVGEGKSLTIIGESENAVISYGDNFYSNSNTFKVGDADYFALVHAGKNSAIHLENVTVSARQLTAEEVASSNNLAAILTEDADVYMDGVTVTGLRWTEPSTGGLFGMQTGFGIRTTGTEVANDVVIKNSTFSDFQKAGILVGSGAESANNKDTVTIEGNTVTGVGATDKIAQNGMQISVASVNQIKSIKNNTVSNLEYTIEGTSSTGIMLVSSGNSTEADAFNSLATEIENNNTFIDVQTKTSVSV